MNDPVASQGQGQGQLMRDERHDLPRYADELPKDFERFRKLLANYSGIPEDQVDDHVRAVREKAWSIHPYPCVGQWRFLDLSISQHPLYPKVLSMLTSDDDKKLLDMGCCFAQDLRSLAADGVPSENLYGADLRLEFLDLGYDLFRDKGKIKAHFYEGDALALPGSEAEGGLKELNGQFDIVHAASFLHLFSWEDQVTAACRLVSFFKPDAKEAVIFGRQIGTLKPGKYQRRNDPNGSRFAHDLNTFQQLWDGVGEKTGTKWKLEGELRTAPKWRGEGEVSGDTKLMIFQVIKTH
ncbi:hypothetical protein FH972_022308 [Carpinus fangiana]|uniref:Methyltransferase domain-containing protein n=1 Tax=Carpinus fangiana TaxID=176857 RepID=A0A5N6KRV8_9ROSI|nr:hypothetical protein FH972_022308 [Carpinus fangiana]